MFKLKNLDFQNYQIIWFLFFQYSNILQKIRDYNLFYTDTIIFISLKKLLKTF